MIVVFRISNLGFGGAERVFISVAGYLSKIHNAEIHFVVDRSVPGGTENVARGHGFKVHNLNCRRTLKSIIPMKNYIDIIKPDILFSAYTDTNFAALISVRLAAHKCLAVVTEHASLDEHWQHSSLKRRLLLNTYVKLGYRLADHVLAVSKGIAGQILARMNAPDRVSFIHNPIRFKGAAELESPVTSSPSPTRTILAVGRIARPKDYPCLLRAFQVVSQSLDCRLVIVGGVHEQAEKEELDRFISANGLRDKIEFVGFTDEVENYYKNADVFVLSSAWEGFGNVIVEAMAFGVPVVSTDCNHGPAEILNNGEFGLLVPVGDSVALATAIRSVLTSPSIDKLILQKRAAEFSEERIGEKYWALIKKLLAKR